jgi:hypothetical protein
MSFKRGDYVVFRDLVVRYYSPTKQSTIHTIYSDYQRSCINVSEHELRLATVEEEKEYRAEWCKIRQLCTSWYGIVNVNTN